jgi:hypothetical protein
MAPEINKPLKDDLRLDFVQDAGIIEFPQMATTTTKIEYAQRMIVTPELSNLLSS